jgi:protein disulfide-isomerase A1
MAEENRDKLVVAIAEKADHKSEMEHLNVQNDDVAFAIQEKGKWYRYEPEDEKDIGKFDGPAFKKFAEDFVNGDVKEYKKSERVPKSQGPVTVVVGSTFEDIVNDDEKDVMIEFYAP